MTTELHQFDPEHVDVVGDFIGICYRVDAVSLSGRAAKKQECSAGKSKFHPQMLRSKR